MTRTPTVERSAISRANSKWNVLRAMNSDPAVVAAARREVVELKLARATQELAELWAEKAALDAELSQAAPAR